MNQWLASVLAEASAPSRADNVLDWCEDNVRLIGSARSEQFRRSITPWANKPLIAATSGECRTVTFVKPVQSGGSAAGQCALCFWIATENGGDIQYNWETDEKAAKKWLEQTERIFMACPPVMAKAPARNKQSGLWKTGHVIFPHLNFTQQGAFNPANLDSDTITRQINEEVHNWEPGHLEKAYNRTTAVWNAIIFNISNAGKAGGQLNQKFDEGTQEHWEVRCPHCRGRHRMRTRWDPKRPDPGGLRYDADGCRLGNGLYDYNKLERTIRYQMPCGGIVLDDRQVRKAMSEGGDYGPPQNRGARAINRSFILEAVAVDYIPWIILIQEKHAALRALRMGDPEPWWRYLAERECVFFDPKEDRPVIGEVLLNTKIKKNREGLANRVVRFAALDRQQGVLAKGELPHWWLVIRDIAADGDSLLVWEGKLLTDEDVVDRITSHQVPPTCVVADSGDDTTHVYQFCLRQGYNCIKGSGEAYFAHPDGGRRIFSVEKPLHLMLNAPRSRQDILSEPLFWHYSKSGIRERLHWWRGSTNWVVPSDVSEDYKAHMESEELRERTHPRTGETIQEWVQVRKRNDLFVAEAYIAMLAEMAGVIGSIQPKTKETVK